MSELEQVAMHAVNRATICSSQLRSLTPKSVAQEPLLICSRQRGTNPFLALEERTGTERLGCALGD